MKASTLVVCFTPTLLASFALANSGGTTVPLRLDVFEEAPLQVVGGAPGFAVQPPRLTVTSPGLEARGAAAAAERGAPSAGGARAEAAPGEGETQERPEVSQTESVIQYVFYCFGPVFGNDGRSVDPNFIPPPTAHDGSDNRPTITPVVYTRVEEASADMPVTTWVGEDGSRITYQPRSHRTEQAPTANLAAALVPQEERPDLEQILEENRREFTNESWARAFERYPELQRENSPERAAFEPYLARRRAEARGAELSDNPMWREMVASEFMESWRWRQAEADSWDRVRARMPFLNDGQHPNTRRFLEFTAGLRRNSEDARIFQQPTWPERALELHNQRMGPLQAQ